LWKPNSQWRFESGLRWSKYNRTTRKLYEPRFHLSFIPFDNWTFHAHWGRYHQALNQVSVFTNLDIEKRHWSLASEENEWYNQTPIAQNQQWAAGTRFRKNNWSATMDFYKKSITNVNTLAFDFTFRENPYILATMDIRGLETAFQFDNSWLSLLWAYEYTLETFTLLDSDEALPSPYNQPHKLSFFQGFKWKQLELSIQWKFATGRPYSEPSEFGVFTNADGSTNYGFKYEELLSKTTSNYHSMDLSASYHINSKKKSKVHGKVAFSILNVYNRQNIIKKNFFVDYRFDPFREGVLNRRGLPFTPNIALSLNFGG